MQFLYPIRIQISFEVVKFHNEKVRSWNIEVETAKDDETIGEIDIRIVAVQLFTLGEFRESQDQGTFRFMDSRYG